MAGGGVRGLLDRVAGGEVCGVKIGGCGVSGGIFMVGGLSVFPSTRAGVLRNLGNGMGVDKDAVAGAGT